MTTYKNRRIKPENIADEIADMIGYETNAEFTEVKATWWNGYCHGPGVHRNLIVRLTITDAADNAEVYSAIGSYIEKMLAEWGGDKYELHIENPLDAATLREIVLNEYMQTRKGIDDYCPDGMAARLAYKARELAASNTAVQNALFELTASSIKKIVEAHLNDVFSLRGVIAIESEEVNDIEVLNNAPRNKRYTVNLYGAAGRLALCDISAEQLRDMRDKINAVLSENEFEEKYPQ